MVLKWVPRTEEHMLASELVKVYGSILKRDWPDGFDTDMEGIAEIVQL